MRVKGHDGMRVVTHAPFANLDDTNHVGGKGLVLARLVDEETIY